MAELVMSDSPEKPKPTSCVTVSKDDAEKMKVGSEVELHMKGRVKEIRQSYDNKESYEVVIEEPSVEMDNENEEDDNYATMPREKLKKKIQDASDEE